jgi:hypothetical protein
MGCKSQSLKFWGFNQLSCFLLLSLEGSAAHCKPQPACERESAIWDVRNGWSCLLDCSYDPCPPGVPLLPKGNVFPRYTLTSQEVLSFSWILTMFIIWCPYCVHALCSFPGVINGYGGCNVHWLTMDIFNATPIVVWEWIFQLCLLQKNFTVPESSTRTA